MITSRPAAGTDDLRAASDSLARAWLAGSSRVSLIGGDLAWWYAQAWPAELGERLRLWQVDAEIVGWSWFDGEGLEYAAWTGDASGDAAVERAVVEHAIAEAAARRRDGLGTGAVEAWAAEDDRARSAVLDDLGFERADPDLPVEHGRHRRLSQFVRTDLERPAIDERALPDGYRIRSVSGPSEIAPRVAVHRAAFAPSKMRAEKYERLVGLPDYRYEDDLVVEAPDGSLAAFAMAWWDPVARVGEFEPVGTDPRHQRRGLASALLCHGLRRYRSLGARLVQVFSDADNAASEAAYQSVGFTRRAYHEPFVRPGDHPDRSPARR